MDKKFDNTNRGAIWKNEDKKTDTQPDFKGSINVDGKEFFLNAWKRKDGASPKSPALSLSVMEKTEQKMPENVAQTSIQKDDEIPF